MLSLSFTQSTTQGTRSAVRNTVEASFRLFGSYLALILRFVGMILSRFQRFSIDNSMVKKLYTADNPDDKTGDGKSQKKKNAVNEDEEASIESFISKAESEMTNSDGDMNIALEEEVSKRGVFSYDTGRWYLVHRMSSFPFCCGCTPKKRRDDRLFADAKQKLYEEIDLLEIVKKLRVNQFASDVVLKPRQRDLVNLFLTYKLNGEKEIEKIVEDDVDM